MDLALENEVRKLSQLMSSPRTSPSSSYPASTPAAPLPPAAPTSIPRPRPTPHHQHQQQNRVAGHAKKPPTDAASSKKEANQKMEEALRNSLKQREMNLRDEAKRIRDIDASLNALTALQQGEINSLRSKLEVLDRQLAFRQRDADYKRKKFELANEELTKTRKEKEEITEALTNLILESERIREEKLLELRKSLT